MTGIQWTNETWNPLAGCSKKSAGCQNCYAIPMAARLGAMAIALEDDGKNSGRLAHYKGLTKKTNGRTEWTGQVNFIPEALQIPIGWKKPRKIFVNSMSDLFHESVPFDVVDQIFAVMALTPHHVYQILTKRPDRMLEYMATEHRLGSVLLSGRGNDNIPGGMYSLSANWPLPNVWLGTTVENQKAADDRIPLLLQTPAALRFLSCEPLLEAIDFMDASIVFIESLIGQGLWDSERYGSWEDFSVLSELGWVICGGESGHGARDCDIDWLHSIVAQCKDEKTPVFVKQLGAKPYQSGGVLGGRCSLNSVEISDRKGAIVSEWPEYLQIQEFPES